MFNYLLVLCRWVIKTMFSPVTIGIVAVLMTLLYMYLTRNKNYWKNLGIKNRPYRFPLGDSGLEYFTKSVAENVAIQLAHYKQAGKYEPVINFMGPAVNVSDPELIKAILVKDFEHFTTRQADSMTQNFGIFSKTLTSLSGQDWKDIRNICTPAFSTGKIKQMCVPCEQQADVLAELLYLESEKHGEVSIRDIMARYTMDNISTVAFGLDANSLRDQNSVIASMASRLIKPPGTLRIIWLVFILSLPQFLKKWFDLAKAALDMEAVNYIVGLSKETIRQRQARPELRRTDFLQMLLDTREAEPQQRRRLSDEEVIAQCVLFYLAGYDTTSNALTWAARLLAFNPDVQQRLQAEIDEKLLSAPDDRITLDMINTMPYLDGVLAETLRLYPIPMLPRCCTKPYQLPDTDVHLPKDCMVQIQTYFIHRDERYYPNPERFDPDRFLPEAKAARHPYTYMPFGHGPRNCIGMRMALLQAKLALVAIVRRYSFVTTPRSGAQEPELQRDSVLREAGGTWLRVETRAA